MLFECLPALGVAEPQPRIDFFGEGCLSRASSLYDSNQGCGPNSRERLLSEECVAKASHKAVLLRDNNPGLIDRCSCGTQPVAQRRSSCLFSAEPERLPGTPKPASTRLGDRAMTVKPVALYWHRHLQSSRGHR